jgi:hypothetical protein
MNTWFKAIGPLLLLSALPAAALPPPISSGGVGCGTTADSNWDNVGPIAGSFSLNCDRSGVSTWPPPGGRWQSVAGAVTGYVVSEDGAATGIADASASVLVEGTLRDSAEAGASASIHYQVAFEALAAPPFAPPKIAILYTASGEASVSGADSWFFYIGSTLGVDNFPYAQFQRQSVQGAVSASFSGSATLWVAPSAVADAHVYAICNLTRTSPGSGDCQANADPVISFDQAAFDALYGADTFDLASAYRIAFSPAVPEAATAWMWLSGLAGLLAARRRKARPAR